MKLTFLGTGAADWPRKKEGNGFARYLSSALVNDEALTKEDLDEIKAMIEKAESEK